MAFPFATSTACFEACPFTRAAGVHTEKRELPAYAIGIGKDGPSGIKMVSSQRPVIDQTGLTAHYDFTLDWSLASSSFRELPRLSVLPPSQLPTLRPTYSPRSGNNWASW